MIFQDCKNGDFQMKNCELFLIFAQNIDCGYTLEPSRVPTIYEPRCEKTGLRGFRPGPTQTGLYSQRR